MDAGAVVDGGAVVDDGAVGDVVAIGVAGALLDAVVRLLEDVAGSGDEPLEQALSTTAVSAAATLSRR